MPAREAWCGLRRRRRRGAKVQGSRAGAWGARARLRAAGAQRARLRSRTPRRPHAASGAALRCNSAAPPARRLPTEAARGRAVRGAKSNVRPRPRRRTPVQRPPRAPHPWPPPRARARHARRRRRQRRSRAVALYGGPAAAALPRGLRRQMPRAGLHRGHAAGPGRRALLQPALQARRAAPLGHALPCSPTPPPRPPPRGLALAC